MKRFYSVLGAPDQYIRFCAGESIEDDRWEILPEIFAIDVPPRRFLMQGNCVNILLSDEQTAKDDFESMARRGRT